MLSAYLDGKPHGFGLLLIIVLVSPSIHARIIPQSDIIISETPLTSLTFGSCNKQNKPQPMWEFIQGGNGTSSVGTRLLPPPEAFVWLGDVIYGDSIVWPFEFIRYASSMEVMRDRYHEQSSNSGYKQLVESPISVVGVWDDHDYGLNDGDRHYVDRAKTQQLFLDFMGDATNSKRRTREGVYGSYVWGPEGRRVLLILLDIRYHQDYAVDDILGPEQWSWLNHTLIEYDPQLIIFGSGIQFLSRDKPIGEGWRSFPRSKARLFELLHSTNMIRRTRWNTKYASTNSTTSRPYVPAGHLFLSGDVHFAEISSTSWCEVHPTATSTSPSSSHPTYHDGDELWIYPLHEITSSGLTHSVAGQTFGLVDFAFRYGTPDRIVWTRQNFGRIDIHWDTRTDAERHPVSASFPPPPSFSSRTFIHINIYNVTGETTPVLAKWKLSDLQPILKKVVISHNITSPSYPFEPIQHLIPQECIMEQKLAIGMLKLYSISGIKGAVISISLALLSIFLLLRLLYILCIRRSQSRPVVLRQLSKKNK